MAGAQGAGGAVPAQLVRTAVFAVLATVLGLAAHVAAGGMPPAVGPALLVVVVTATVGSLLSSGAPSATRAVLALGAVQVVAHTVFMAGPRGGHLMPAGTTGTVGAAPMLAGHAFVVLVTAWMLARGEQAVLTLLARVAVRLPGPVPTITPDARPRPLPFSAPRAVHDRAVTSRLLRRGPPQVLPAVP